MVNSRLWNYYSCWIWHRSLFDYWCSVFYCYDAADQHLALFFIVEVSIGISEWSFSFFSILYGAQNLIFLWRFWILVSFLYLDQNFWMFFGVRYWDQNFSKKIFFLSEFLVGIRNSTLRFLWGSEFLNYFLDFFMEDQNFWVFFGLLYGDQSFWVFFGLLFGDQNFWMFFGLLFGDQNFWMFFWTSLMGIRISECFLAFFMGISLSECFLDFFLGIRISECFLDFFVGLRIPECFFDFFMRIRISECFWTSLWGSEFWIVFGLL